MLRVYIFAAIVGGGLLLVGMLAGKGEVADAADGDLHFGGTGWAKALSSRTAAYALAAFGLTGTGLTLVGTPGSFALPLASVMGVFGGALAAVVFRWLQRTQGGFGESSSSYIGGIGRTEIRVPAGGRGRIALVHRGRSFTLPAISRGGEIDRLEAVLIIDVVEGVAVVERAPGELTDDRPD